MLTIDSFSDFLNWEQFIFKFEILTAQKNRKALIETGTGYVCMYVYTNNICKCLPTNRQKKKYVATDHFTKRLC